MRKIISAMCIMAVLCITSCTRRGGTRTFYASECGIVLNSDVYKGGGTDQTAQLQAILDKAPELGRLHLVLDGAALISAPLRVHSNTTIECPDKSCGVFLADGSDCSCLSNTNPDLYEIRTHNITILGGVYNNNSPGQAHHREESDDIRNIFSTWVYGIDFYGVENLTMKDVTIANQRTFGFNICNWKNVTLENIHIDRRERPDAENQDGLHFFGPGQHLVMRNIYGNVGDDFIALAPDEHDKKSSISDVLIDGVWLDEADQGIRILCQGEGSIDQVTIRNVHGNYRSFGFTINPWFDSEGGGHYGNIIIDNVDLHPMEPNYGYTTPYLFKLGGSIESLTLRNIYLHNPEHKHQFCIVGSQYMADGVDEVACPCKVDRLIIDGMYVSEDNPEMYPDSYIKLVGGEVGLMVLDDVVIRRPGARQPQGVFVQKAGGRLGEVVTGSLISTPCLKSLQGSAK